MVGRNNPCPCGSGKKYKKCCANKEEQSQDHLVEDELAQIVQQHADNILQTSAHLNEVRPLAREWKERLKPFTDVGDIEELVIEYYLFIAKRELWSRHILKVLNDTLRSQTRAVLKHWHQPIVLLGKVVTEEEGYYKIEEVLGHQTYRIKQENFEYLDLDHLVLGLFMQDNRKIDNGVYSLGDFIGIQDSNNYRMHKIQELAESSGIQNSGDFFEKHMLDIYEIIMDANVESVQQIIDEELTPSQESVVEALTDVLESLGLEQAQIEPTQMIAISYLLQAQPSFRKPEVIAAAVFKAVDNYGLFGVDMFYSQQDVAKIFEVSVSSMAKHIEPIEEILDEFVDEMFDHSLEERSAFAYFIGTDPQATERVNWEVYCRVARSKDNSQEAVEKIIEEAMHTPFVPKGKAEQAQAYAYDAYEQEDEQARKRLAAVAYHTDPNNVDALLLKVEDVETIEEMVDLYKEAVTLGKATFKKEADENPWRLVINRPYMRALFAYAVFLFEQEKFDEAAHYFIELLTINPNDNQGVRHFAIASVIHAEEDELAESLLEMFPTTGPDQAVSAFLQWFHASDEIEEFSWLEEMLEFNEHILDVMGEDLSPESFPRNLTITPGSIEEALYIAYLARM